MEDDGRRDPDLCPEYILDFLLEAFGRVESADMDKHVIGTDDVLVHVGTLNPSERFEKEIKDIFRAKVRVAPSVIFHDPEEVARMLYPPMSRKPVKFIDNR